MQVFVSDGADRFRTMGEQFMGCRIPEVTVVSTETLAGE